MGRDPASVGATYQWDEKSTYVRHPPYFDGFKMQPGKVSDVKGARVLGIFGDSITTDHISPAGGIRADSARPASTCRSTASASPTSIPTARAAAITKS